MKTVMIVDDSEADQLLSQMTLEDFNSEIEILQAYDGEEALEILAELPKQPDIIFLDINMPRMNGHEFLEEYETWKHASAVIIMLTSSDQSRDKEKSAAFKCVKQYCTKPLEAPQLKVVLKLCLEQ